MKTLLHRHPATDARGWTARPRPVVGRRGLVVLLVVALAGGMFVSVAPPRASADALSDAYAQQRQLEKQIKAQKARLAALAASQASLGKKLSSTKATLASVVDDLTSVRTDIVAMVVEVANAQAAVDELGATVSQLDSELADLEAQEHAKQDELTARKAVLADRIRAAYDTDRTSLLEAILSSSDFTDVLSEVGYHLDFAEQDKVLAEQIRQDQEVLAVLHQNTELTRGQADTMRLAAADQKATLDTRLADLNDAKAQLAKLQKQYDKLVAAQQSQYAQLSADTAKVKAELSAMLKAEKKLQALVHRLVLDALRSGGIPSQYSGSLKWPMSGVITQPFGCTGFYLEPPLGSCAHFHRGIDIATDMYTPIHAAGPGRVIFVGRAPYDPAWIVVIAHSAHLVTWYYHVDNRAHPPPVHVGQYVTTDDVIAYEGMTGWTTGPHLHWGVQLDGTWVNPRLFL